MIAGRGFCYESRGLLQVTNMAVLSLGERRAQVQGADWYIDDGYMRRAKLFKQQLQPQPL